jgi:peptidoglycan/LPS O-acetylase OafA/YrhL
LRLNSLDGLRGVAIILVLLMHHRLFNNGWMGVDLFFVLSGFLITEILRAGRAENFYWRRFYLKRVTRILPPLILTVLLAYIFTPGASMFVALGYLFSISGFLELTKYHITPLGPLWSLAVEEHFYLLWPFAVRFLPRRSLLGIVLFLILGVPLLRFVVSHPMPMAELTPIYFLSPFRMDEMAFGCLLAVLLESRQFASRFKASSKWFALATSSAYLFLWIRLHHIYFFPGAHTKFFDTLGYSMLALFCFFTIAHVRLNPHSWTSRVLCFKPLVFIGRISYGIYLYHLLIKSLIMWGTGIGSEHIAFLFDMPAIVILSWFSFKYYETPIMRWGKRRADAYLTPALPVHLERNNSRHVPEPLTEDVALAGLQRLST